MNEPDAPAPGSAKSEAATERTVPIEVPTIAKEPPAIFAQNEERLFELYSRFRFNELACLNLSRNAAKLERWVRRSVVGVLAVSLFTPVIPGMSQASLKWAWESLTVLATLLGIYSMIVSSGARQFEWFRRAMLFRTWAGKLESFSTQVKRAKVSESELDDTWDLYIRELNRLIEDCGIEFNEYVNQCRIALSYELDSTLSEERKLR